MTVIKVNKSLIIVFEEKKKCVSIFSHKINSHPNDNCDLKNLIVTALNSFLAIDYFISYLAGFGLYQSGKQLYFWFLITVDFQLCQNVFNST